MRWLKLALFLGVFALLFQAADVWHRWMLKAPIEPAGGRYFFRRLELNVPLFRQNDPRWGRDRLGPTENTLGAEGCALASAAMVLASYGIDTDPPRLNRFVNSIDGYTPTGWLYWEAAAAIAPERVQHVYEDLPSYRLIDSQLAAGNPVIVRLRYPHGVTHFVVIAGKQGYDYLVRDPGAGASKGLYPLREFGSPIEALRYYRRLE
ncbi:MAG: C39 family peptidase [Chthoniobacteraceae bacterium]